MILKKYNQKIGMLSLFTTIVMLSGCDMVLMDPKGAIGMEQKTLILTAIGLMLIVVIPVIFMAFAFTWKFRSSNSKATYRPDWAHSNQIEMVVWSIPIIIIIILATITWKTTHDLDPYKPLVSGQEPITIEVVSLDWKWLFIYPEQGIATVNQLAFPINVPVNFKVTSDSVMNSFFIPQLGGQIYAMAGMQTKLHLIANEAGKYNGISSSYSGKGFSGMKFTAVATPTQDDFEQWVQQVKKSSGTLDTIDDFNKLAEPSENNPVEYFSSVKPNLFKNIIDKFMGDMSIHHSENQHNSMNMSGHSSHADAEE